jgi:hypothetical protein
VVGDQRAQVENHVGTEALKRRPVASEHRPVAVDMSNFFR